MSFLKPKIPTPKVPKPVVAPIAAPPAAAPKSPTVEAGTAIESFGPASEETLIPATVRQAALTRGKRTLLGA